VAPPGRLPELKALPKRNLFLTTIAGCSLKFEEGDKSMIDIMYFVEKLRAEREAKEAQLNQENTRPKPRLETRNRIARSRAGGRPVSQEPSTVACATKIPA